MNNLVCIRSTEEMRCFGAQCAKNAHHGVIALSGDLGAGKTTFSQGFLAGIGATGSFTSPTFVVMKQYDITQTKNGIERVYHVDAYRVDEDSLIALGFGEWLSDVHGLVLLEWPERVSQLIPRDAMRISFVIEENVRKVTVA